MNIQNGLRASTGVLNVLGGLPPLLGALVEEAEISMPEADSGKKLDWVEGVVRKVLIYSGNSPSDIDAVMPTVTIMVNAIIAGSKGPQSLPTQAAA